jgi:hypothetical protein
MDNLEQKSSSSSWIVFAVLIAGLLALLSWFTGFPWR